MKLVNILLLSSLLLALPFSTMGRLGEETDHVADQGKNWLRSLASTIYITLTQYNTDGEVVSQVGVDESQGVGASPQPNFVLPIPEGSDRDDYDAYAAYRTCPNSISKDYDVNGTTSCTSNADCTNGWKCITPQCTCMVDNHEWGAPYMRPILDEVNVDSNGTRN